MLAIRRASVADADAVAATHVASWNEAYGSRYPALVGVLDLQEQVESRRHQLRALRPGVALLVGEEDATVIGFTAGGPCRDEGDRDFGEVYALYVLPARWGRGVGGALLEHLVEHLAGFEVIVLWVLSENAVAQRCYQRHGFTPDGRERLSLVAGARVAEQRWSRRGHGPPAS